MKLGFPEKSRENKKIWSVIDSIGSEHALAGPADCGMGLLEF
ncbi:MAG: hypothetical protein WBP94_15680 [Rhodomicrobiaceae bacterium]